MGCRNLFTVILLWSINLSASAQQHGISTAINLSYSGLSQSFRYSLTLVKMQAFLGPKLSYSKNRTVGNAMPGLSFQLDVLEGEKGKYFVLYEYLPQKINASKSHIHETYAGYGFNWDIGSNWHVNSGIGIGFYLENGNAVKRYSTKGLSYCSNLGISYRF